MLNELKGCTQCKEKKHLSKFGKFKSKITNKYYYKSRCKECDLNRLKELSKRRKTVYSDGEPLNWGAVYRNIRRSAPKRGLKVEFSKKEFLEWKDKQSDQCHYCKCSLIKSLGNVKFFFKKGSIANSKRFQIDRKDSAKNYTLKNICYACSICNSHKVDFYTEDEFLEVAKKYIIPILNKL